MRLQSKILWLLIPLVLGPLAFIGVIAYDRLRDAAREQADAEVQSLVSQIKLSVDARIEGAKANLGLFSNAPLLRDFLAAPDFERTNIYQRPLVRQFSTYQRAYPEYYEMALLGTEGEVLAGIFMRELPASVRFAMPNLGGESRFFFMPPERDRLASLLVLKRLAHPMDDTLPHAYLAVLLDLSFVRAFLDEPARTSGLQLAVIEQSGQVIFASTEFPVKALSPETLTARQQSIFLDTQAYSMTSAPLITGLRLIALVPEASLNAAARDLAIEVTQIILIVTLATVILVYVSLRLMVVQPLRELGDAVTRIAAGNLSIPIKHEGRDEVAHLASNFEDMRSKLLDSQMRLNDYNRTLEEKVAERTRELVDAQQQLVLREKVASIGVLTAGVAHEINNPVNFIHAGAQNAEFKVGELRTFLFSLMTEEADQEITTEFDARFGSILEQFRVILEGSSRIRDIVQNLRIITHLDQTDMHLVDVVDGLRKTIEIVRTQQSPGVSIVCDLQSGILVPAFGAELNQLFISVMNNAYQAIEDRHAIDKAAPPGVITIHSVVEPDTLRIIFSDNGCGMSVETRTRAFDPFFTTREVGRGTGLGLSIAQAIMNKHDGVILLESTPGEGTTVSLVFPLPDSR